MGLLSRLLGNKKEDGNKDEYVVAENIARKLAGNSKYSELWSDLNELIRLIERFRINEEENLHNVQNILRELGEKSSQLKNDKDFQNLVIIFS